MPAPSANAFAAPVLATPTASTVRWIPSPPLPPLALVTRFGIVVTHSATSQIVALPASLPVHGHPPPPPSTLSCVRRSPRSSSLPPNVEAAERTCTCLYAVTCYHPPNSERWRHIDWFQTRVPDQTQKRPHFIQSVIRPVPSTRHEHTAHTQPIFMLMGGPQAHINSKFPQRRPPQGLRILARVDGSHELVIDFDLRSLNVVLLA